MALLRGHHLICLHFFHGEGYTEEFVAHLIRVIEGARSGGGQVSPGADDVCGACPYVDGQMCAHGENADEDVRRMDKEALALLGYAEGEHWRWDDLAEKIPPIFSIWFAHQCAGCEWRGSCEKDELFRRLRDGMPATSGWQEESSAGGERTMRGVPGSAFTDSAPILFSPGTLWQKVVGQTHHALRVGALIRIPTDFRFIEDGGVRFFVRAIPSLRRKDEARRNEKSFPPEELPRNPFLPYEEDLFVSDISSSHVAILNKFNVVDYHLLIVTRNFEEQEALLTRGDFEALWACMEEYEGLGFYNGGREAGASQGHKHLQLVPLPIAPSGPAVPIDPLLSSAQFTGSPFGKVPPLSFRHSFTRFDQRGEPQKGAALRAFELYCGMLENVGIGPPTPGPAVRQSAPYCLLVTRRWMLLVPRSREFYGTISINSLGFAGAMLVRGEAEMEVLATAGPMTALRAVSLPL